MRASLRHFVKFGAKVLLRRNGKAAFLRGVPANGLVLDLGCGSDSPARTKEQRPDITYVGVDVGDYNHTKPPTAYADQYLVVSPEAFAETVETFRDRCDAIISSHNIEHCLEPARVIRAMARGLKKGGRMYLSFPCEESVHFPSRRGTLNFFDDSTHAEVPIYAEVLAALSREGLQVEFARKRHRPSVLFLIGLVLEPISAATGRTMPGLTTWALYGFESVIWARA